MSRLLLCIAASTSLLMGCILRDFDYEPPANHWPSVENVPTGQTPLNRIAKVDLSVPIGGDGGVPNELRFELLVRDDDVQQPLEGRVYVDNAYVLERLIPAVLDSPDPRRRPVSFDITRSSISQGCHLVELLVSSEDGFEPFPSRNPLEAGDIAAAQWWIAATPSMDESIEMICPEGQ